MNGISGGLSENGGWDFQPFWYHGQFLKLGTGWAYDSTGPAPATYTPALNFLLSIFSYFPIDSAKTAWVIVISMMVLLIPWVTIYLLPLRPTRLAQLFIVVSFYSLTGISIAIRVGQPSILVVFFLVSSLALYKARCRALSGLFMGLALSKVTLGLPILLYFAYKRQWLIMLCALSVQIIAGLALIYVVRAPFLEAAANYLNQINTLAGASHINLIHIAGHFNHTVDGYRILTICLGCLMLFGIYWIALRSSLKEVSSSLKDHHLLAFLTVCGLLIFYSQQYDIGISVIAISLLISAVDQSYTLKLSGGKRRLLIVLTVVSLFTLISFPGLSYIGAIQPFWAPIRWKFMTFGAGGLLITTMYLWHQITKIAITMTDDVHEKIQVKDSNM